MALLRSLCSSGSAALVLVAALCVQTAGGAEDPALKKPAPSLKSLTEDERTIMLRKMLSTYAALNSYNPAANVTAYGKASREVPPDLVTIKVKLVGKGKDVGTAVAALNAKKKALLGEVAGAGAKLVRSQVTSLDVREKRRRRSEATPAQENYQGHLQVALTMKTAGDPLDLIAKVTDGRVEAITQTRFEVSAAAQDTTELKQQALADARKRAEEQAGLLKAKLGRLINVSYRESPRRAPYGGASIITVHATAVFAREDETVD